MKKFIISFLVILIVSIVAISDYAEYKAIDVVDMNMERLSKATGMSYLGIIKVNDISRKAGNHYVYDGDAVCRELLSRAGLDEDSDVWSSMWKEMYPNCVCCKLTVFEPGQENKMIKDKRIKTEYLYVESF